VCLIICFHWCVVAADTIQTRVGCRLSANCWMKFYIM